MRRRAGLGRGLARGAGARALAGGGRGVGPGRACPSRGRAASARAAAAWRPAPAAASAAAAALDLLEPRDQLREGAQRGAGGEAHEPHLERGPRRARLGDVLDHLGEAREGALELLEIDRGADLGRALALLVDHRDELGVQTRHLEHHHVSIALEELPREVQHVQPVGRELVDVLEHGRAVAVEGRGRDPVHDLAVGDAEHARDLFALQALAAEGHDLVEQGERVAHGARRLARHDGHGGVVRGDRLRGEDLAHPAADHRLRDEPEVVALAARPDGHGDLVDLRGREDELDVVRGLLERLQEGVEGAGREHVDLVDDHHLEAVALRPVGERLLQSSHVLDAVVRGAVHLQHVGVAARGDVDAHVAGAARLGRGAVLATQRLGQDAGGGRLADAAHAREQERVGHAVRRDGVGERTGDVLLADEVGEGLRTVFSCQDRVRHEAGNCSRAAPRRDR